ncbi:MAG: thioredoxin family protein [Coprobacillaceae bacterium]
MVVLISGCSNTASTNLIKKDTNLSGIHEISYEELQNKLKADEAFVLYIGRPDCGDCEEFYPILESYLTDNKGTYVYYLNVKAFRDAAFADEASEEEITFFENIKEELSFTWTPTLHLYEGNEIKDSYTYLDAEFYDIEDEKEQADKKEEFVSEFKDWMTSIYK